MLGGAAGGSQQNNNSTPRLPTSRLAHPTSYHLQQSQQMRFKDDSGLDPSQMMEHQHLYFAQQAQQENSPNLSDLDYSELTASSSASGMPATDLHQHHQNQQQQQQSPGLHQQLPHTQSKEYIYDQDHHTTAAMNTTMAANSNNNSKRISGPMTTMGSAQLRYQQQQQQQYYNPNGMVYYPVSSSSIDQGYYYKSNAPFPVSAPANIGYNHMHHPSLVGNSVSPNDGQSTTTMASNRMVAGAEPPVYEQTVGQGVAATIAEGSDVVDPYEDDFAAQANLQAIMEKRRRRRESHNEVERRRRDNINDRIHELGQLLPDSMTADEGGIGRLNKGAILRKSVEQIKVLQRDLRDYQHRVRELEETLHLLNHSNQKTRNTRMQQLLRQA